MKTVAKKPKTAKAWCACFDKINEKLEPMHAALDLKPLYSMPSGKENGYSMQVPVFRTSSKCKRLPLLIMSHCPFCGKHLKSPASKAP